VISTLIIGAILIALVPLPVIVGTVLTLRFFDRRDRRAHFAQQEMVDLKREELQSRNLELGIRQAEIDLARRQLEAINPYPHEED
jgi:hypothetical protein